MKKRVFLPLAIILMIGLAYSCKPKSEPSELQVPEYNPMISAFTSGLISSEGSIKVRFSDAFPNKVVPNTTLDENVLSLNPRIEGTLTYLDQNTIEFRPKERFDQGTSYEVEVKLNKLFPASADEKAFSFSFQTVEQHFSLDIREFRPYNDFRPTSNYLTGGVQTTDAVDPENIQALFKVIQEGRELHIRWEHGPEGKNHSLTIDSIVRMDDEGIVEIRYDGSVISSKQKGLHEFKVPALGDFKIINHKLVQHPEQHVVLAFSDPIRKDQSLEGLIRLSNDTDMRYIIEGSSIKAYPNVRQNGELTLYVELGVRNTAGKGLLVPQEFNIQFEDIKPAVEMLGNGVIIPSSDEVLLPFKAVNLKAVDLKVIRIYEDNIAQFLQVNQLSGSSELKRAGRLLLKKEIKLLSDKPIDYGQWNTFSLNLTELIRTEPGAIYRIELNFRQSQSMYHCEGGMVENDELEEESFDHIDDAELSYWDSYEGYYNSWDYYYYDGYTWNDREDPCKPAYYGHRRAVAKNVLASNLGIIAKYGSSQKIVVTVTDLLEAEAVSNAEVKVYNFQQQLLAEGSTNGDGSVELNLGSKPFLVIAEYNGQKGYLRLVDGSALSYSMFDVSGTVVEKGIKGFMYAERGVWRPGDSIFVNLILNDSENPLPAGHPVVFELRDPMGKTIQKRLSPGSSAGFYPFHTSTSADAPTGRYNVTASVGGVKFHKTLMVETIKPNRLKIDLSFDTDTLYPSAGSVAAKLFGKWLTGATAKDLRAEIEVVFKASATSFKGYEGYTFTNPGKRVSQWPDIFWTGKIDANGNAKINRQLEIDGKAPGMLKAVFTTRLFEKSGEFSIDQQSIPCSPYNTYVGIKTPPGDKRNMLLTDTTHIIKVATLAADGSPLTKIGLEAEVYKLSWRWWWDASNENLASYMGSSYHSPVYSTTLSSKNGEGSFNFRIDYPEWGRCLVVVKERGGHSAAKIVYVDWPGWAGRAKKGDPDAASVLSFTADREYYKVGEKAEISIPSSTSGKILISLENGSGVLKQEWIDTKGEETKYSLDITSEMTPNVYLYASLIQAHKNTENDLPIRMFGVIPLMVEDPDTRLYPEITMPDELAPNAEVEVRVSEKYKKEMTYTIAIVDEGLLDLTRFATPDPWKGFYSKEALGVKTWDMFEHVLGAYGGRIDGIYNVGGGMDDAAGEEAKDANRFPPMVKFVGPFTLKGKQNKHVIQMPNYIGSVRTMLIAGNREAYGFTDKTTPVKQPLMLLATLPRVLGPSEKVALPVNVFVMDEDIRDVELELVCNDMLIPESSSQKVRFDGMGDQIVDFMLETPEKTGIARVKILATSGKHTAEYEIELQVRSSNPPVTQVVTSVVEASESLKEKINLIGMSGTNDLLLEVSNIPPVDFGRRLKYLLNYPHGCIEQTTSAAFPQLFLGDVMELNNAVKSRTETNVKAAINRLNSFQISSGGFSYWPGAMRESDWGSSYAGHFLLEAREKGYNVPESLLNNWERYQKKTARRWSISTSTNKYEIKQEQILQSYRLFTLALAGEAEMGSMNRLRERKDLTLEAKWRLAAAYAIAGQKETAKTLISGAPIDVQEYNDSRYSFGSSTRDQAMILEAMILIGMKENGVILLERIAEKLSKQQWMSTQTTAYSLVAVAKFTGGKTSDSRINFEYSYMGGVTKKAETGMSIAQIEFAPGNEKEVEFELKNNTKGILFVRLINTGTPKPGEEKAIKENLNLEVFYTDMIGNRISPSEILQGTDFKVVYKIHNPGSAGYLDNLAMTAIFPGGWEIHNERLFSTSNTSENFTYQDIRDDRVLTYFSLAQSKAKTFTLRLNAAYKGTYYLPSLKVEEMYNNNVQVVVPGQAIVVKGR